MGKIAILGLGDSLKLFNPSEFDLSVGVNDIWRYHHSEAVVCLDKRSIFGGERRMVIDECSPDAFYSQIVNWDTKPSFKKIELTPHFPFAEFKLDMPRFYKSYCSPFVACQIAFRYYRATEIHLFGVDMVSHPHLTPLICSKIKAHFLLLARSLEKEGCEFIVHGNGILSVLL